MKKTLALLLASLMLISCVSCAQSAVNDESASDASTTPTAVETGNTENEPEEENAKTVLARFEDVNYDGHDFNTWARNVISAEVFVRQVPEEEMTGEPINDAMWMRDKAMEEKYNIHMTYVNPDNAGVSLLSDASKLILSGDDSIDIIFGTMVGAEALGFVSQALILDMATMDKIDLTQPYWSQNATKTLAINGKVLLATGDVTCRYMSAPYLFLFNKQMLNDLGYALPYDDVRAGNWTFDKFEGMIRDTYRDLDGNGKVSNKDFFGFTSEALNAYAFYNGFGYDSIQLDGMTATVTASNEANINAVERLSAFYQLQDVTYQPVVYQESYMFREDRALFVGQTACNLGIFTEMETDFGVVPSPKENEEQERYYSYVNPNCATAVMIPITCADTDRTSTILETLAAVSRVTSMRESYEVTLQYRQTRDEDSVEMLRICAESAVYDLASIYGWGTISSVVQSAILEGKPVSSSLKASSRVVQKAVEKAFDKYND